MHLSKDEYYEAHRDNQTFAQCMRNVMHESHVSPPHFHRSIEMIYVESGFVGASIFDKKIEIHPGNMLLVGSNAVHGVLYTADPSVYYVIIIPISTVPRLSRFFADFTFTSAVIRDDEFRSLLSVVGEFSKATEEKGVYSQNNPLKNKYYAEIVGNLAELLLYSAIRLSGFQEKNNKKYKAFIEIIEYIQNNYRKPITVSSIAKSLGYTAQNLTKIFSYSVDMRIKDYVNQMRIRDSRELLKSDIPLVEVSETVGFSCFRTFIRSFEKYCGCTPSKYRESR